MLDPFPAVIVLIFIRKLCCTAAAIQLCESGVIPLELLNQFTLVLFIEK